MEISSDKDQLKEKIKQCLQRSTIIFTAIYGPNHPFVRDYVLGNLHHKTNPSFLEVFIKQKPLFKFHI